MSSKAIANMTGLSDEEVEQIRKDLARKELAQSIVNTLCGHFSLAASNPERTIKSLKALLMRGLQTNASEDERIIAAEEGERIAQMGGQEWLRFILNWE